MPLMYHGKRTYLIVPVLLLVWGMCSMPLHASVPPMPRSMSDVTARGALCTLVPLSPAARAMDNDSSLLMELAYDRALLPRGASEQDIYTFRYDSMRHEWLRLDRVTLDTARQTVVSRIGAQLRESSGGDFANAVISVPELPQTEAFAPTVMADMPDPDPLQGIPMVQVNGLGSFGSPTGDNSGSASLMYPIVIPAGRHGLQPDVSLHYNSANGNGPLGVGWSLPMPAVTIDTRWGVPRYSATEETEAYLVNGEPVVRRDSHGDAIPLPYQDSLFRPRGYQTERFWFRDTRNATRVIRHGRIPTEYWWEVTGTDGVTYYYGRAFDPVHPDIASIDENSVLRTADSCIGYWALTAVVDLYGNYVRYENTCWNNNVYPSKIRYTGNHKTGLQPTYTIEFTWKSGRLDAFSDGRLGLLRKTSRLLCQLGVLYNGADISRYYLSYDCSSSGMWKSRLTEIQKADDEVAYGCECESLSQALDNASHFEGSTTTFAYNNVPQSLFGSSQTLVQQGGDISKSHSGGWNIGGTVTVGGGFNVGMTSLSAGGHYNFSMQYAKIESMLLDLNGDGLPDMVYQYGDEVWYLPQLASEGGFSSMAFRVSGLKRLSRDVSRTHNWGLQLSFGATLGYSNPISLSYTDYYFSDINADGLPDMVTPDGVLFNRLDGGHPSFSRYTGDGFVKQHGSACPSAGMLYSGAVDERLECEVHEVAVDSIPLSSLPPDAGWVEPVFRDTVFPEDGSYGPWGKSLSLGKSVQDYHPIRKRFLQTDADRSIPDGFYEADYTYRIKNGWIVKYGIETICHNDNPDPTIETVRVWTPDGSTNVQWVRSSVRLRRDTSVSRRQSRTADGVRCIIQLNRNNQTDGSRITSTQAVILHVDTIPADEDSTRIFLSSGFTMAHGDILSFRLCSNSNTLFDDVDWDITIRHSDSEGTHEINSSDDYICTGNKYFVAPFSGEAIIRYKAENDDNYPVFLSFYGSSHSPVTIPSHSSSGGAYVAFGSIQSLQEGDTIRPVVNSASNTNAVWSHVHIHPEIEFHWTHPQGDSTLVTSRKDTLYFYPDVDYPCSVISADSVYTFLFGKLHKGWGRFAYHPQTTSDTLDFLSLVNTERKAMQVARQSSSSWDTIPLPQDSASLSGCSIDSVNNIFVAQGLYNPLSDSTTWVAMYADSRTERWLAYGGTAHISQGGQSNWRKYDDCVEKKHAEQQLSAYTTDTIEDIPYYDSAIPIAEDAGQNKTLRKSTKSVPHNLSGGAMWMNASVSWGTYSVITDFIDLNGDGFPDAVGPSGVQYTMPWGGLGTLKEVKLDSLCHMSSNMGTGFNFSGSVAEMKKLAGNSASKRSSAIDGGSGALCHNSGYDETDRTFVDMNGDGLPDIVSVTDRTVRYNLGYRFAAPETIQSNDFLISVGTSVSLGANAAMAQGWEQNVPKDKFGLEQYSISAGVDGSASKNISEAQLMDINGDGLPDLVRVGNNGNIQVAYNLGESFTHYQSHTVWTDVLSQTQLQQSQTKSIGASISGTVGFSIMGVKLCFGVQGGGSFSTTRTDVSFMDMNGDGCADHITRDGGRLYVKYNRAAETNLLRAVTNPTGHSLHLTYELSEPSQQHRQRTWLLTTIEDRDTLNPWAARTSVYTYRNYQSPFYDNHERADYGYREIGTNESFTRFIVDTYINDSYLLRGYKDGDIIQDEEKTNYIGHRYSYYFEDIGGSTINPICDNITVTSCEDAVYTDYYEGESEPQISTRVRMRYDDKHNLVAYYDDGDIAVLDDDWIRKVHYLPTDNMNLVSLPVSDSVQTAGGALLRLRYASWYNTGRLHQMKAVDPLSGTEAMTTLKYDSCGNVCWYALPCNANNERVNDSIRYDNPTCSRPVWIKSNAFGETHQYVYSPQWGLPVLSVDPSGAAIEYSYDRLGRLTTVLAPQESTAGRPYTVRYTYNNICHDLGYDARDTLVHAYVLKEMQSTYDVSPVTEASIYSARGELLQTKKRTEVCGSVRNLTGGRQEKDTLGRTIQTWYPSISPTALWVYDGVSNSTVSDSAVIAYDVLDRDTLTILPDGAQIRKKYYFAKDCNGDNRLSETITDPLNNSTISLTTPQGWLTKTTFADGTTTCYDYNCIGERTRVVDAEGLTTCYNYDGFGQRIERIHPDAGTTRWLYDPAGYMVVSKTQNQIDVGDSTTYHYQFGRLMEIRHALHPWENTSFDYDNAGRLAYREDRTGSEQLLYDELGNVRQTLRRIILPTENRAFQFKTGFSYDSFGKIRVMTYPDREEVFYHYTQEGGLLSGIQGYTQNYQYDELGHIASMKYANGCETTYKYDAQRQWATNVYTHDVPYGNVYLNDLNYSYDAAGNIADVQQTASAVSAMGGPYHDTYYYDSRYRLTHNGHTDNYVGTKTYDVGYSPTTRIGYKVTDHPALHALHLQYGYDYSRLAHYPRTVYDVQSNQRAQLYWDSNGNLRQIQPTDMLPRYHLWDDDNQLLMSVGPTTCGYYGNASDGKRAYKITGSASGTTVGGSIEYEANFKEPTLYPNAYVTVTPDGYTKHYFAGKERVATAIGGQPANYWCVPIIDYLTQNEQQRLSALLESENYYKFYYGWYGYNGHNHHTDNTNIDGDNPQDVPELQYLSDECYLTDIKVSFLENPLIRGMEIVWPQQAQADEKYFYHRDHLGSAAWVTDIQGVPVQYMMYAPYGEELLNQKVTGAYHTPYTFTDKERDPETGYLHFDARKYIDVLGIWTEPDPLLDQYIENTAYAYCNGNPIKYVDPNGEFPQAIIGAITGAATDYAIQVAQNMLNGDDFTTALTDNIDLTSIAVSAATGAIGVGLAQKVKQASTVLSIASKASTTAAKTKEGAKVAKAVKTGAKTYQTYQKVNEKTGEVYIGRTSGNKSPHDNVKARDKNHHKNADGFGEAKMVNTSSNRDAIRGQEQILIEKNGGAKSLGGSSGNAINGVSPNNPNAEKYRQAAITEFGG